MKSIKFSFVLLFWTVAMAIGCSNGSSDNKITNHDTATKKDTINSDPSNFSEPH